MNNPRLKTRESFATTVDPKSLSSIRELSKETRIPISKLTDEAIEMLYHKYKKLSVIK